MQSHVNLAGIGAMFNSAVGARGFKFPMSLFLYALLSLGFPEHSFLRKRLNSSFS